VAPVDVQPYDPDWPRRAAELAAQLHAVLGPRVRRVEHIGSTAVPGLAAKPTLDLQVSVAEDLAGAAAAFDVPFARLGFARRPFECDHVPAGRDDPPQRWAKRLWARADPPANVHVRLVGSPNERLALLFRDWLRAHPAAVPAYGAFKARLAATGVDLPTYADVKDPVVDVVVVAAEAWAARSGWRS
jgi:GrpB-like predicted nucleotidyltransferase (UPF0157 family)